MMVAPTGIEPAPRRLGNRPIASANVRLHAPRRSKPVFSSTTVFACIRQCLPQLASKVTLVANSRGECRQAAWVKSRAKVDWRVGANGVPASHAPIRTRLRATAVITCCRGVLGWPT